MRVGGRADRGGGKSGGGAVSLDDQKLSGAAVKRIESDSLAKLRGGWISVSHLRRGVG